MAAAEQEERPAEATVTSIVSTPLGKMAKTSSPKKPPRQQLQQRAGPGVAVPGSEAPAGGVGTRAGMGMGMGVHTPTGAPASASGGVTPLMRRLGALDMAATPPLACATRHLGGGGGGGGPGQAGGSLLAAPKGDSSRVLAAPELLPVPYTHRLQRGSRGGRRGRQRRGAGCPHRGVLLLGCCHLGGTPRGGGRPPAEAET